MTSQPDAQFDFLQSYIHQILDNNGFEAVSEETRNKYVPQFVAEAQRRLGLALLPHLSEKAATDFSGLVENENLTQDQLVSFWKENVPDFENIVQETLKGFAEEIKGIFADLQK